MATYTPTMNRVTLPSGNTYYFEDKEARELIDAIKSKVVTWIGVTTTEITDGSTTNPITISSESVTAVSGNVAQYDSLEFIFNGTSWQEFGKGIASYGAFAFVDTGTVTITPKGSNSDSEVTFTGTTTDNVLGENTTFTNSSSSVSFGTHSTADVLTDSTTATVPKTTGTTKYLTVDITDTSVEVATDGSAITSLGSATTDTFVKSYTPNTKALETASVIGVTDTTTTASKATAGTEISVARVGDATTVASGSLGSETSTRSANTVMWGMSVSDGCLSFTYKPISTTSVTPAVSNGTIVPYTFEDVDVPVKDTVSTTVATGGLVNSDTNGGTVMTDLGTPTTSEAVTAYGNPKTATFAKTVAVTTQPTVSITANSTTSVDAVPVISTLNTNGTSNVTFNADTVKAITGIGTATAEAQTITVGANDKVTAVTDVGTATAEAQTFTGMTETYTVNPNS